MKSLQIKEQYKLPVINNLMSRSNNHKSILSDIKCARDNVIDDVYSYVLEKSSEKVDKSINSRAKKIKFINEYLYLLSDDDTFVIKKMLDDEKNFDTMYNVLLNILNNMLLHMGREKITVITDFKDILRSEFSSDEYTQIILDNYENIEDAGFSERVGKNMGHRKSTKNTHILMLKELCEKIGYKLSSHKVAKMTKGVRTYTTKYAIEKCNT